MEHSEAVDVVVIGAGLSGLCAAALLVAREPDSRVVVLEARDRVGGRTASRETPHGALAELGGAYVGPTQDRILRVAASLGIGTYPVPCTGKAAFHDAANDKVLFGSVDLPPLSIAELLDFNALLVRFHDLAEAAVPDPAHPAATDLARRLDHVSVREWTNQHARTARIREFFPPILDTLLCKTADEVSMLYYLFYARAGGSLKRLMDIENGAQERKFQGGAAGVAEALAARLQGRLRLSHAVAAVDQRRADRVAVSCRNGAAFHAARVVLALAPPLYDRIAFRPALPGPKARAAAAFSMGCIIKTYTYYRRPWWREAGLSGQVFAPEGPVLYSMDDTKPDGAFPCLMGFVLADHAKAWAARSPADRRAAIAAQYARLLQSEEALAPLHYEERDWSLEEFSGGCYVASPAIGAFAGAAEALRAPFDRIFFAGTETATAWPGYMDGAVQAGERAALEALASLHPERYSAPLASGPPEIPSREVVARPAVPTIFERAIAKLFDLLAPIFSLRR